MTPNEIGGETQLPHKRKESAFAKNKNMPMPIGIQKKRKASEHTLEGLLKSSKQGRSLAEKQPRSTSGKKRSHVVEYLRPSAKVDQTINEQSSKGSFISNINNIMLQANAPST